MGVRQVKFDDLDGKSEVADTILFFYGGEYRVIDLSATHAEELDKVLAKYIAASALVDHKTAQRRILTGATGGSGLSYGEYDAAEVRAWARANNKQVTDKGRVPDDIVAAWREATAAQPV